MAASAASLEALLPDRVDSLSAFAVERVLSDGGDGNGSINGAPARATLRAQHARAPP